MATGGGFVRSIEKGCDVFYDFTCTPCSASGRNVEAINFCVECEEYICQKCLEHHNKFGKMKLHQILDKTEMKTKGPQQVWSLPTERCQLHHGNILDTYCGTHDEVCCGTCVSLHHRLCKDMEYLPTAAIGIQTSEEFKYVKSDLQNIQLQLNKMKKMQQKELRSLESEKSTILTQIKDFRKKVMKRLDELEKIATDELQTKHQKIYDQINADINNLDKMLASVATSSNNLQTSAEDKASQMFVQVKTGKKNDVKARTLLHKMETCPQKHLTFRINRNIEDFMNTQKSLGEFQKHDQVYSASLYGEFDMKIIKDRNQCNITGSCVLDNGTVLVVDYNNKKLKRLSGSYTVRDYCDLPGEPFAVCAAGPQEVAVTLHNDKKVQFVSVGDKMTLTRSFSVQGDYQCCTGVAYTNNQLFVLCTCPAALLVYNMSGTLQKTIQQDPTTGQNMFSSLYHLTLSRDQTKLHIADWYNGLITLDIHGDKQSQFTDPDLQSAQGVGVGSNDEILVCGYYSNNIIQVGRDGRKLGVVLGETDGIKEPQSLYWDRANSRIIVTMCDTNHIKVFHMNKK